MRAKSKREKDWERYLKHRIQLDAKQYIGRRSYNDRRRSESLKSRKEGIAYLKAHYKSLDISQIPDAERGEVLADSRGRGTLLKAKNLPQILDETNNLFGLQLHVYPFRKNPK